MVLAASSLFQASEAIYRSGVSYGLIDPEKLAEYRLYTASADRFIREIEQAIANGDHDYAEKLYALGVSYGHELPPDLKARAEATWVRRAYASGTRAAEGFIYGSVGSGEEIAGSLASDLIGVGDVRDFSVQGYKYIAGEDYDPFLLGFATLGLGLTAATYTPVGMAATPDAGVSIVKNAYRSGRISRPLLAYFSKNAAKIVDTSVLKTELKAASREGVSGIGRLEKAAAKSVDKTAANALLDDMSVLDRMRRTGGIRASVAALSIAEGPKELRRLERVVQRFGEGSYAVMKFLGRSVLHVGYDLAEVVWAVLSFLTMLLLALIRLPFKIAARFAFRRFALFQALRPLLRLV